MDPYIYFSISSFNIALQSHNYELPHHKSRLIWRASSSWAEQNIYRNDSRGSYESSASSQLKHQLWHISLPFFSWTHCNKAQPNDIHLQNPTYTSVWHWSAAAGAEAPSFQYCSKSEQQALLLTHMTQLTKSPPQGTGHCTGPHCFSF